MGMHDAQPRLCTAPIKWNKVRYRPDDIINISDAELAALSPEARKCIGIVGAELIGEKLTMKAREKFAFAQQQAAAAQAALVAAEEAKAQLLLKAEFEVDRAKYGLSQAEEILKEAQAELSKQEKAASDLLSSKKSAPSKSSK